MSTLVADASLELTLSDSKNIRTNIKFNAMATSNHFFGFHCVRDDDDDGDDGDDDDDDDDDNYDDDGAGGEGGENDKDDDVIFVEGIPKQKTGQMDSLTPF